MQNMVSVGAEKNNPVANTTNLGKGTKEKAVRRAALFISKNTKVEILGLFLRN